MTSQTYFKKGNNNIDYVEDNFQEHFYGMDFDIPQTLELRIKPLEHNMTDRQILAEFKPQESKLGELAYALEHDLCSHDGYANIFYIQDKDSRLWAVSAYWSSDDRDWRVNADSVENPRPWSAGSRVFSRDFGTANTKTFDPLTLEISEITVNGRRYKLID